MMDAIKKVTILLLVSLVLILSVSATRYVDINMLDAVVGPEGEPLNPDGNFFQPINDVNVIGFVCGDEDCSQLTGTLWEGQVLTTGEDNSVQLTFPTELQSQHGYGIYFYKEDYIPWEVNATLWGTCDSPGDCGGVIDPLGPFDLYLGKKQDCHSHIDQLTVINDVYANVPLVIEYNASLDATAHAAIQNGGPLEAIPAQLEGIYSVDTRVVMTVKDVDTDEIMFQETKDIVIPYSGSERVEFTWTPEVDGSYIATASTEVTDAKCLNSIQESTWKRFNVLPEMPRNMCYTLLNNLTTDTAYPDEDQVVTISVDKISNYANDYLPNDPNYELVPVPTATITGIIQTATEQWVFTNWETVPANENNYDFETFSQEWTPSLDGWYNITILAFANHELCEDKTNLNQAISETIYIQAVNDLPVVSNAVISPDTGYETTTFTCSYDYYDEENNPDQSEFQWYNQDGAISGATSATITGTAFNKGDEIYCKVKAYDGIDYGNEVESSNKITILNSAPSITSTAITTATEDVLYTYDVEAADDDLPDDTLTFSLTTAPSGMTINEDTGVIEWIPDNSHFGEYNIVIKVEDSDGASDTQEFIITVAGVDDPAVWESLGAARSVDEDSDDGTMIYEDITSKCTDIDSPIVMTVDSTHDHYTLYMDGDALKIKDMELNFNDETGEIVTMDCNSVHSSFLLMVDPVNDAPIAEFTMPTTAPVFTDITFDASLSSDVDEDTLTYEWDFGNGDTAAGKIVTYKYEDVGEFDVKLTVSDGQLSDDETKTISIDYQGTLIVDSLNCFDPVIADGNQSCTVKVEDEDGNPISGVNVNIYFSDDSEYGSCVTDSITGGCEAKHLMEDTGTYTVYAQATKPGYEPDNDKEPQYTFNVIRHRYDIVNLKVYNDPGFTQEDYDFLRGEPMYVSFQVTDLNNNGDVVLGDIITNATLVSPPGGRAQLDKIAEQGSWYYYELNPIPLNHDFLGNSQVFTFAFNFSDNSGGQKQIDITIRNNPPEISGTIPNLIISKSMMYQFDLTEYEFDLEDGPADDNNYLNWEISGVDPTLFDISIDTDDVMTIVPYADEGSDAVTLTLKDLDGDTAQQDITLSIDKLGPVANAGGPYDGKVSKPITFDGSKSYDPNGQIVKYTWDFGDGSAPVETTNPTIQHTYTSPGNFNVQLTIEDNDGFSDSDATLARVSYVIPEPVIEEPEYKLGIYRIRFVESEIVRPGDNLKVFFEIKNTGDIDLEDLRITTSIPYLDERRRVGPFELKEGQRTTRSVNLMIPEYAKPGEYVVRITASDMSRNVRRVKHRFIKVL